MADLPDKSVDMVLCDLPYGMTDCKWDNIIPFDKLWEQYNRVTKENGVVVLFSAQPFTTKLIYSNLKNFRYCWYWLKPYSTGFCFARYQPMRRIEDICVFYRKAGAYSPQGLKEVENAKPKRGNGGEVYNDLGKIYTPKYTNWPVNVLKYDGVNDRVHPTQKPVELLEYLVRTYTQVGETVLDNCMGSGSTGVACLNTGRRFIGIEKDEGYFNKARERIEGVRRYAIPETGEIRR